MRYVRTVLVLAIPLVIFGGCINSIYQARKKRPPEVAAKKPEPDRPAKGSRTPPQAANPPRPVPPPVVKEPWANKPPAQWPHFVLTNDATFRQHTGLRGASAFLVRDKDGLVLAATARHLLGPSGGVKPTIEVEKLDEVLVKWKLHPRTDEDKCVWIHQAEFAHEDFLLLSVKPQKEPLPVRPLPLRENPVQAGEKVFLLGCPYSEEDCDQNVYAGKVLRHDIDSSFHFTLDPPVDLRGFSGAPVIDANGWAVGVLTTGGGRTPDGKSKEAGAEDLAIYYQGKGSDSVITVTEAAARKLQAQLAARGWAEGALRLSRKPGNDSSLGMELCKLPRPDDWVGRSNGLRIVVSRADLPHLRGTTVNYYPAANLYLFDKVFRRR